MRQGRAAMEVRVPLAVAIPYLKAAEVGYYDTATYSIHVQIRDAKKVVDKPIRVNLRLPVPMGTSKRICVFARGADADKASAAGATIVGAEDLIERVSVTII